MKQKQILRENKKFLGFCLKLHERLTILLDDNIHNKRDPIEEDITLLNDLYSLYDTTNVSWVTDDLYQEQVVIQSTIFNDKPSDK